MATQHRKQRKSTIRSHPPTPSSNRITETMDNRLPRRKKLFGFLSLGCGPVSSSAVAVHPPGSTRPEKNRRKKKKKNKRRSVCCAPPVVGFTYDVAQSTSSDANRRHRRQRSRASRGATDRQRSLNNARIDDGSSIRSTASDSRQYNRLPRRSPGGISEIVMIEHNPLLNREIEGSDRFGTWRINADIMSYEELVELGDRIGYVDGGLQEEEILECLKRPKKSFIKSFDFDSKVRDSKCSICQEECKGDEDLGRLECGHYHHIDCIKQWLLRKNECPICKTVAKPDK